MSCQLSYVSSDKYRKDPLFSGVETLPPSKCFYHLQVTRSRNTCFKSNKVVPMGLDGPLGC